MHSDTGMPRPRRRLTEPWMVVDAGARTRSVEPTPSSGSDSTSPTEQDLVLYTPARAAELLAVRESWLRRKAAARVIPCTFLGKHLRFSIHDVRAIARLGAQPARRSSATRRRRQAAELSPEE